MAAFVEIVKNVFSLLSQDLEENTNPLHRKIELLKSRKDDVHKELCKAYLHGKKRKRNVEKWLIDVENIISKFKTLKEVCLSRLYERKKLAEHVDIVNVEVTELGQIVFLKRLFLEVDESIYIWTSLMDDSVLSIDIYGMGGVGKTTLAMHVCDKLLNKSKFSSHVHWVKVSQDFSVYKLQNDIVYALKLDFSLGNDERKRTAKLSQAFKESGRFVLILDNVWKQIDAEQISVPLGMNGCKLVVTSRIVEVCHKMGCQKIIKVNTLSEQEAWDLFLKKLGRVELRPQVEGICRKMIKRCGGLPLALVTLAGSMRGVTKVHEWRDALEGLAGSCVGRLGKEHEVLPIFLYSYDRLSDTMLKRCFLHCSLYLEDHHIPRDELVESFILEELMEEKINLER